MASEKTKRTVKICGYLEKRGKLTITGKWKKWWCVLDGQLLLYYKSRRQYLKLSPCCGSLNIALVKSVQPHSHQRLHLVTHSQLVVLRASSKEKQQSWFLAFVNILQKNRFQVLFPEPTDCKLKVYEEYCDYCRNNSSKYCDYNLRAPREVDFDTDFKARSREAEQIEDTEDESPIQSPIINRTSSNHIKWEGKSEMTDGKQFSSQESLASTTDDAAELGMDVRMKRFYSVQCVRDSVCDIALSTEKSFSYHSIVHYEYRDLGHFTARCESQFKKNMKKSGSKNEIMCSAHKRSNKESFNFLKKVFSNNLRRQTSVHKLDSDARTCTKEDEQTTVGGRLQNHLGNQSGELTEVGDKCICSDDENIEQLKRDGENPKRTEKSTPSTGAADGFTRNSERHSIAFPFGIMMDNASSEESPILPVKRKINTAMYSSKIAELNSGAYDSIGKNFGHEIKHSGPNLDLMLQQLSMLTQGGSQDESSDESGSEDEEEDPDYDVPIPHASLIYNKPENDSSHNFRLEHSSYFHMTPDSLEASWVNRWSTPNYMFGASDDQPASDCDVSLDSLMTPYSRR